MNIKENITITLSPEDVKGIIKEHLASHGYDTENVSFNVSERCEGYPTEFYVKYLQNAVCEVRRV